MVKKWCEPKAKGTPIAFSLFSFFFLFVSPFQKKKKEKKKKMREKGKKDFCGKALECISTAETMPLGQKGKATME